MDVLKKRSANVFYPLFGWEGSPKMGVLKKVGTNLF